MSLATEHITVLREEAVEAVVGDPDGVYVDATFGRGGHSEALLSRLGPRARLFGFDRDQTATQSAMALAERDSRFRFVPQDFAAMQAFFSERGLLGQIDGILFDLGVSSPQLDRAERGFSFQKNGPLDMRMDQRSGLTAAEWLNTAEEKAIADVLYQLGEERRSHAIARAIVEKRNETPLATTQDLVDCVCSVIAQGREKKHPATRTFQAVRLYINQELEQLRSALTQTLTLLKPSGRFAVISFHSLEDRIVKQFIREHSTAEKDFFGNPVGPTALQRLGGPIRASRDQIVANPRARSAIMRIAQRVA
ncbi:MAG TPA: 16S rRNA (cytosine(1402)-N(4))-methyltransferase RsmH [Halothiobacillaceae bacterium]|nr:16S rRNA (cytosine(1402)-N(4))-methyltransferase RsmH [Halothiobacillaceae bacterium]